MEDEHTGKVSCQACHNISGDGVRIWMSRGSWKKHLATAAHLQSIRRVAQMKEQQAATRQQYDNLYNMAGASLQSPELPFGPHLPRAQFRPILAEEDSNGISAADFEDMMMQEVNDLRAIAESEPEKSVIDNEETIRREAEILRLRHLEDEFEGADDVSNGPATASRAP
jgi:hypothetical protein